MAKILRFLDKVLRIGILGVPAPFIYGFAVMLITGLVREAVEPLQAVSALKFSFAPGVAVIVLGFLYGLLRERAEDKSAAGK